MATATIRVGPADNGRRMTLEEFESAERQEGHLYELGRGVVQVTDVPGIPHLNQMQEIQRQIYRYNLSNPGVIYAVATGSDCKILLDDLESERHPDLSIYKSPPPDAENVWNEWIPEIVIEVVSPSSVHRDYNEKRDEYLQFGIREYWIFDADRQQMLVLRRSRGKWAERVLRPGETYETPLLPGMKFDCGAVLKAARPNQS